MNTEKRNLHFKSSCSFSSSLIPYNHINMIGKRQKFTAYYLGICYYLLTICLVSAYYLTICYYQTDLHI